jgi:hypothetical protein
MPEAIRDCEKLSITENNMYPTTFNTRGTPPQIVSRSVDHLISLAAEGLVPMFNAQHQLFCFRRRTAASQEIVIEGISHRYTIMALLGLHQLENSGGYSRINCVSIVTNLLRDRSYILSGADVGLTLWLMARIAPHQLEEICPALELENVIHRYRDMRDAKTMELAWFLTGLAQAAIADTSRSWKYERVAEQVYQLLVANQGPHGIFGHQARKKSMRGVIRGRIGSFADQIYPIYALSKFAVAYPKRDPVDRALKCAAAICNAQGPLGQWWWHYDAVTGNTVQRYPVYSVHQDGMAPMGLFALSDISSESFDEHIFKGLNWLFGANELKHNMTDPGESIIWRAIAPRGRETIGAAQLLAGLVAGESRMPNDLAIVRECRPYHFGWVLYSFSSRRGRHTSSGPNPRSSF